MSEGLFSRRFVLMGMVSGGAYLASSGWASAAPLDDVLAVPSVDLHSHAGGRLVSNKPRYDVAERMVRGRFGTVTMAAIADQSVIRQSSPGGPIKAYREPKPGECFASVGRQLDAIDEMIGAGGFQRVLAPGDVATARAAGKAGIIVAVEGADFLEGKLDRVKWAFDRGVRHLQLVHYRVNELGDIMTEDPVHNGLTAFGADVVRECNRLGIIVDVAHATAETTLGVAKATKAPLVMSHGGITSETPRRHSRMMSLDHAKIIAGTGGLIGMWPAGALFRSIDVWAGYLAKMTSVVGVDHVGIGSDMEGGIEEVFNDYAAFPKVVEALLAKGMSVEQAAKIAGANHARVFKAVAAAAG
ncbi:MAG: rane dipeptidase family protein [Rhodospirillales bacterium]|nr:rane dipeptidase family protein [Rhodospirillales bacterium]